MKLPGGGERSLLTGCWASAHWQNLVPELCIACEQLCTPLLALAAPGGEVSASLLWLGCFQQMMGSAHRLLDLVIPEWRREGNPTYLTKKTGQDGLVVLSCDN